MNQPYYVELRGINKTFGNYQASHNINFGIEKGKLIGLLGPSGSGKTTILRMLAGLETADSGEIIIDGKVVNDVHASKRGIGFVFQSYALFRYLTVFENIAFGLRVQKWDNRRIRERVMEMLHLVGLDGLEKRYPSQLSGGQRQRVAFARALAPQPQLLLLDEPFAAIDAKVRKELRAWLREMISTVGVTSIFVTHDQDEAIEVADQIIIMNHGHIEQIGSPVDIYREPSSSFVAQFIGESAELPTFRQFKGFEDVSSEVVRAVIRPEYISAYKKGEFIKERSSAEPGTVERVAFRGSEIELNIRIHDTVITAIRPLSADAVQEGETVLVFVHQLIAFGKNQTFVLENANLNTEFPII